MSGAARINSKLPTMVEKYEPPTTIHVNLKKHPSMNSVDVGKKMHFTGHGIVRSIRKDEHEHTMQLDVKKIKGTGKPIMDTEEPD